jgi:hypothetical protein
MQPAGNTAQGNQVRFAQVEFENETEGPLVLHKEGATPSETTLLPHSKIALSSRSGESWTVVDRISQCVIKFASPASAAEWNVVIPVLSPPTPTRSAGNARSNPLERTPAPAADAGQASPAPHEPDTVRRQSVAGAWADAQTRLMWTLKDDEVDTNWKEATTHCQEMRTEGFSDWRLPTIDELGAIFDNTSTSNTVPLRSTKSYLNGGTVSTDRAGSFWPYHIKGGIVLTGPAVWSGTPDGYRDIMWMFFYNTGNKLGVATSYKRETRALCVRP